MHRKAVVADADADADADSADAGGEEEKVHDAFWKKPKILAPRA